MKNANLTSLSIDHLSKAHTVHHGSPPSLEESKIVHNGNGHHADEPSPSPKPIPGRPNFLRSNSTEKTITLNGSLPRSGSPSPSTPRRNSWLSSISSKFSSSPHPAQAQNGSPTISTPPT